jgi:hypothetical protein
MTFSAPEWFFLLPALAVLGWRARSLRLHEPVRALALLALVLALADPRARMGGGGLDLWVLMDRSDSIAAEAQGQAAEVEAILRRSQKRDDRVFMIDYAADATRRERGDPVFRGTGETRTGAALGFALARMEPGRAARLLVLTDGYATEPLGDAAEQVLRAGVPLDYRLGGGPRGTDYRVSGLSMPNRVLPGEAFLVEFSVTGNADGTVPWEVWRDGKLSAQGEAEVRGGPARVRLGDRLGGGGAVRYEVRARPADDAHPENNHATAWVEVAGGPRVLLVTNYPDDPLAALLGAQGLRVERVTEPAALTAASLAGARLVVLNNVPAHRVPAEFLGALDFFVREQGGGLLMAGGRNSFGSGGWFASAIDPLLPVSMELKNDHRRLATALAIILDRSGSMAMSAGAGWQTKMDLANTGAARAIELLGDLDAVAVFAVDSSAHEIVALAQVGPNRARMTGAVRRIRSEGGGIFVGAGLRAGWEQLQKAQAGQLHLILFADAADAEQPENYREIIAEMRAAGATVSAIGLGSPSDPDADLLREIAALGGGRIFFNENAGDLPAIFAQETVSVARSAFVREETGAAATPGWAEIAARTPRWLPRVDGYNLGYLRPGATASLVTTDEYQAPLVASWSRGAGRVAAVSFPLGGADSARVRGWEDYGDFVQTLARWLAGENTPPGLALRTETRGRLLTLDLFYDESWAARVAQSGPAASLAESDGGRGDEQVRALVWEKIEPGHFRAGTPLAPGRRVRGAARLGAAALPFGPVTAGGSAEWSFEPERVQELRQLSARSGGTGRLDLASVWDAPRPVNERSLRVWLLAAWLALLLTDALLTRLGVRLARERR